jgi:hypothetical protein
MKDNNDYSKMVTIIVMIFVVLILGLFKFKEKNPTEEVTTITKLEV